jgi:hypothetical protein
MSITQAEISKTFDLMNQRSDAPKLTVEQYNAIDLLILGKTDKEWTEPMILDRYLSNSI